MEGERLMELVRPQSSRCSTENRGESLCNSELHCELCGRTNSNLLLSSTSTYLLSLYFRT